MAEIQSAQNNTSIDPRNGYCSQTKIYHSLRPPVPLPPLSQPHSIVSYALSLLHSPTTPTSSALSTTNFLIDAATGYRLTYSNFLQQVNSLASSLKSIHYPCLSKNDVAFILSPPSLHIPVLYFSLLSLGVAVSPSNPLSTPSELVHQIQLSKPAIAFSTSAFAHKLPKNLPVVLLDSPQFLSMLQSRVSSSTDDAVLVNQSDTAAILYSSGTTGKVKGVELTHRNFIAVIAGFYHSKYSNDIDKAAADVHAVSLFTLPLFHVFGFFMLIRAAAMGESLVLMGKFDLLKMLEAVEKYKVAYIPVAPPLVVAMEKSDLVSKYDLSSLQSLGSGGAPLGKEVSERFRVKFPHVEIYQGYGLTESAGGVATAVGPEEVKRYGSVGRLCENMEAKIVDPESGESLPPGKRGELWLRGPAIMKGYAGDDAATAATLDSEGWLKTGDLCYFDSDGFLFIVDRLKELIKYKGYQVAPYKKIRRVAFVNSIPKSPAGKILRRELLNHALSNSSSKL
ncbi:hypothetical protein DH2020_042553 [Rehmannia glutinosa]|uniref:AMP-dependent synthetase/ligase domain-containing protein n=1 Tax=Rehmannia glutinosa TaxID=99300 RepID=A0ABR0UN34_REHGL